MLTLAVEGGVMAYVATWGLVVAATTPAAMMVTDADADLVGSLMLVAVTVAVELAVTAGAV